MKVYGIDILTGSVRSRTKSPVYALAVVEDGILTETSEVRLFRLIRRIEAERPDILAVDSLQEVSADTHELFHFLSLLPPATRLVQVTGGERKESLGKVAARYNLSFNRFDPHAEARTAALVASLGAGSEVIAFENSSDVVVSRNRSPGKGGWSQNRYIRKIHGAVLLRSREIEMALLNAGIRYEKKETRAFGGCSRVAFRVQVPRDQVPFGTYHGADVQVRITGRKLDRIRFRPLAGKLKNLIVGLDPGTTTAIAALDLEGNLVHLSSSRQMSMSDTVEVLCKTGKPLVIASDVQYMPFSVEKVRRSFKAVAFSPKQDLSVESKVEMAGPYGYGNDHERDALAAALEAYRQYRQKFQTIIRRVPPGHNLEDIRAGIIKGQSLEQIITETRKKTDEPAAILQEPVQSTRADDRIRLLDGSIKRLRLYIQDLQTELGNKDYEIARLQQRLRRLHTARDEKLRKDSEIATRDAIIAGLKKRLRQEARKNRNLANRLRKMKELDEVQVSGEGIPVKVIPALTKESLRGVIRELGLHEGDILLVGRADGWGASSIRDLAEIRLRAVALPDDAFKVVDRRLKDIFLEENIPLLPLSGIGASIRGRYGLANPVKYTAAVREWEKEKRRSEKEERVRLVEDLWKEYRAERGKEVRKTG